MEIFSWANNRAPLQGIAMGSPMQMVAVDILGPLPTTSSGNKYVLVAGDYFTKWMEAYAIPNQEAVTVAKKLLDEMFCRFSLPEKLHSDQGRQFEGEVVTQLCQLLAIEKTRTTPYHPQSDGLIERFNRTLLSMLATCLEDHPTEWDQYLSKLCMAYNSSVQSTTGYSPYFLMFGRDARLPMDIIYDTTPPDGIEQQPYAAYVKSQHVLLTDAFRQVRENTGQKYSFQKELYNKKVHGQPLVDGEMVWLFNPAIRKGQSRKLHKPWSGPYRIRRKMSEVTYQIQHTGNHKLKVVHFNRLKRCPNNIRLPARKSPPVRSPEPAAEPPPVGTSLELLDEEEPQIPLPLPANQRYPPRERRPPDRLAY